MALILLTGASSFSGLWIADALARDGHEVVAPLRRRADDYAGLRAERVARLGAFAEVVFETPFASPAMNALIDGRSGWELLAHHAADIPNYRDPAYDVGSGVARNLDGARETFARLADAGVRAVIATGTTFEPDEGRAGERGLAISPYGLSKGLTNQGFRHFARWADMGFAKFVVAAPFGPWEEGRFVWSLFQNWLAGRPAVVKTPAYVRDNLPAPLLGKAYAALAKAMKAGDDQVCRPSGFVGPQGDFALRVAREAERRLQRSCPVVAAPQTAFPEPRVLVNDEPWIDKAWEESGFWDAYVDYYLDISRRGLLTAPA